LRLFQNYPALEKIPITNDRLFFIIKRKKSYRYLKNNPITTIFFGTFVPIAGGLTIFLGGMLGMILAEIVKFIINLLWTDKRANA